MGGDRFVGSFQHVPNVHNAIRPPDEEHGRTRQRPDERNLLIRAVQIYPCPPKKKGEKRKKKKEREKERKKEREEERKKRTRRQSWSWP